MLKKCGPREEDTLSVVMVINYAYIRNRQFLRGRLLYIL